MFSVNAWSLLPGVVSHHGVLQTALHLHPCGAGTQSSTLHCSQTSAVWFHYCLSQIPSSRLERNLQELFQWVTWLAISFQIPFSHVCLKFLFTYQILLYLHLHLRWLTAPSSLYLVVHVWKHFGIWLSLPEWSTVAVACDNIKRSHLCCLGIVFECVDVLLLLSDSPTLSLSLRVRHCYQIVPPIHFHCGFDIVPINLSFDKQMTLDWLSLIP